MENTIYKCFNNNNIDIKGVLIIDIKSVIDTKVFGRIFNKPSSNNQRDARC